MGHGNDYFSGAGGSRMAHRGGGVTHAYAYQPQELVDHEHLEKLFLGVDFLNYFVLKLLVVSILCLLSIEVV